MFDQLADHSARIRELRRKTQGSSYEPLSAEIEPESALIRRPTLNLDNPHDPTTRLVSSEMSGHAMPAERLMHAELGGYEPSERLVAADSRPKPLHVWYRRRARSGRIWDKVGNLNSNIVEPGPEEEGLIDDSPWFTPRQQDTLSDSDEDSAKPYRHPRFRVLSFQPHQRRARDSLISRRSREVSEGLGKMHARIGKKHPHAIRVLSLETTERMRIRFRMH